MRILTSTAQVSEEICRLIQECSSCQIAVAWATVGFDAFGLLTQNQQKIEKMIVGTHFYQTDPDFIETFLTHSKVRFMRNTDGVFHPKIYFFALTADQWKCVIGSSNFTNGGFRKNDEAAVLVSQDDPGASDALAHLMASINGYWENASRFTLADLDEYRKASEQNQSLLQILKGKVAAPLVASKLMEFATTLQGKPITTLASRKRGKRTLFTLTVTSRGIEFVPLSSKDKKPHVSKADEIQKICDKYESLDGSKTTSDYQDDCRVSTYLITLIDLFENRGCD